MENNEKLEQVLNEISSDLKSSLKSLLEDKIYEFGNNFDRIFENLKSEVFSSLDAINLDPKKFVDILSQSSQLAQKVEFLSKEVAEITGELGKVKKEKEEILNDFSNFLSGAFEIYSNLTQRDILLKLLEAVSNFGNRSLLLLLKKGVVRGWKSYGFKDESFNEKLSQFVMDLEESIVLNRVLTNKKIELFSYEEFNNDAFLNRLGISGGDKFYVVPLVVFGTIPAFIFIDGGRDGSASDVNIKEIQFLCTIASTWIENCTLKRKIGMELTAPSVVKEGILKNVEVKETPEEKVEEEVYVERSGEIEEEKLIEEVSHEPQSVEEYVKTELEVTPASEEVILEEIDTTEEMEITHEPVGGELIVSEEAPSKAKEEEIVIETPSPEELSLESEEIIIEEPSHMDSEEAIDVNATITEEDLTQTDKYEPYVESGEDVNEIEEIEEIELEEEEIPSGEIEFESKTPEEIMEEEKKEEEFAQKFEEEVSGSPIEEVKEKPQPEEVSEKKAPLWSTPEEEKMHRDAKRFARLLVSEIKLYNEEKVSEGRVTGDLYKKLQKDIDRSREAYEQRVSPIVSKKVDYLHEELIRILADGNPDLMGPDYPGPVIHGEEE